MGAFTRGVAKFWQQRQHEEQREREEVIAEFAGDPHAMPNFNSFAVVSLASRAQAYDFA
jgi:hypothetical protein